MPSNVVKNLVVGGVDIRVNLHNSKGFPVKLSKNLHFNNGFIFSTSPRMTSVALVASDTAQAVTNPSNQIYI